LPGQQPYQGVVPLHGDQREPLQKLSDVLEHYMLQSEQLDTKLVLAANDGCGRPADPAPAGWKARATWAASAMEDEIGRTSTSTASPPGGQR
jgi:molecular chaperone Hsp33